MSSLHKKSVKLFSNYQPVFDALSNKLRQTIMFTLAEAAEAGSPLSVHELAEQTTLSRPTISHHIKILHDARLVEPTKSGTQIFYRPRFETPLAMAKEFTEALEAMKTKQGGK